MHRSAWMRLMAVGVLSAGAASLAMRLPVARAAARIAAAGHSLRLEPARVPGGQTASGIITHPAPAAADVAVTVTSASPSVARAPGVVTLARGARSVRFEVRTAPVVITTPVLLTATAGGETVEAVLTVVRPGPASITIRPFSVRAAGTATGMLILSEPAPPGGSEVRLTSTQPELVTLPERLTVPAGSNSATFTARAGRVDVLTRVTLAATHLGRVRQSIATVLPVDAEGRLVVQSLTENDLDDDAPQINGAGQIVWAGRDGAEPDREIFLWENGELRQLTDNHISDQQPQISAEGHVLWRSGDQLLQWEKGVTRQLSVFGGEQFSERMNAVGQVVWLERVGGYRDVFLWDGVQVRQLTHTEADERDPRLNRRGQAVWQAPSDGSSKVYLWDGSDVRLLTPEGSYGADPQIDDAGGVVWGGSDREGSGLFRWSDGTTQAIVRNQYVPQPRVNGAGQILWSPGGGGFGGGGFGGGGTRGLYLWNGTAIHQLADPATPVSNWRLSEGGHAAWNAFDGRSDGLFLWDGKTTRQVGQELPSSSFRYWELSDGGQIVWQDSQTGALFLIDGTGTRPLATGGAVTPRVNAAGHVVWSGADGSDTEIYRYAPPAQDPGLSPP